jgi:hypothetical protein
MAEDTRNPSPAGGTLTRTEFPSPVVQLRPDPAHGSLPDLRQAKSFQKFLANAEGLRLIDAREEVFSPCNRKSAVGPSLFSPAALKTPHPVGGMAEHRSQA